MHYNTSPLQLVLITRSLLTMHCKVAHQFGGREIDSTLECLYLRCLVQQGKIFEYLLFCFDKIMSILISIVVDHYTQQLASTITWLNLLFFLARHLKANNKHKMKIVYVVLMLVRNVVLKIFPLCTHHISSPSGVQVKTKQR